MGGWSVEWQGVRGNDPRAEGITIYDGLLQAESTRVLV